jgi:peptidoglycan hydrolase CwlO-like protein
MPAIPPYTIEEKIEGLKNTFHHLYGEIEKVEKQNKKLKEEIEMIKSYLIKKEAKDVK